MSRDKFDIPEVFRRAMEEAGWNDGDDDNGGRGRRPFPQQPRQPQRPNRLPIIIALLIIILLSLGWVVTTYTEWLWFIEMDYQDVWLRQWLFRILPFVIFFFIGTLFLFFNWQIARRRAIQETLILNNPKILQLRGVRWIINGIALFLGFGFASSIAGNWQTFLQYFYRTSFGEVDPIFRNDISFYLFELPVLEILQQWLLSLLILTLIGAIGIYAVNNLADIQRGQWQPQRSSNLRRHIALLGALILGLWAVGYIFSIYGLLFSDRGVVFGAGYTDLNASLYALYAQMVFMGLTALVVLYNFFRFNLRPVGITAGLWLVATLVIGGVFPGIVQRYSVEPNELERESPYITHNIALTRLAFGLDNVEVRSFETIDELDQQTLAENEDILGNVRLWDYRPLQSTYEELQALRLYYQFSDVDIDRYEINGEMRQVMLAARELNKENLPNKAWVNRFLEFTHGFGIVMNPVDEVTPAGQPDFFIKDLPPKSNIDFEITRPEIYYGEQTTDVVFVGSNQDEFSYPGSNEKPVYTRYEGKGGVPLDNYLKRLAFALRLGDANVLLSDDINEATRIQFHRQIQTRVKQITPFLALDGDPYVVVWNGRLIWIQDAYTVSSKFPYSNPINGINYIRNSVKITIDAYDGTVTYYIVDPNDPIIQTYAAAFPTLFHPISDLPEGLEEHLRYPEFLFRIQAEQYTIYHMTNERVFFSKEDQWKIPTEIFQGGEQEIEPYYVLLKLPGEEESEYLLIMPMTPSSKDNMVAWMAARNDPGYYGQLVVYQLPRQELIIGPIQVEARIDQEPEISEQFTLWDTSGSGVIRGNLLAIPIGNSFLYVEPIYLQATTSALPELKRVIVATNSRIAMRPTLDEALTALLQDTSTPIVADVSIDEPLPESTTAAAAPAPTSEAPIVQFDTTIAELINSANAHFEAAEVAQRAGDWATYGRELEALQSDLEKLSQLMGETP